MLPYINDFPIEFRDYIASEIIPRYADFDKAHRVDHVLKVIAESLNLSQYYDVSRMMVYVIASYHDLGPSSSASKELLRLICAVTFKMFRSSASEDRIREIAF